VQYIIDGKQSMTVLKDVRTLVADAIAAAVAYLTEDPEKTRPTTTADRRSCQAVCGVTVDKSNVKAALIDSVTTKPATLPG